MKRYFYAAIALAISLISQTLFATELTHWPRASAATLNELIKRHAHQHDFAVFDMDNTTYANDLSEALLPFMEKQGVLSRNNLPASLKLIPFKDTEQQAESLYSYYRRLCQIDNLVCYPWIAEAFAGIPLQQLKGYVDQLMTYQKPIPVRYFQGEKWVTSEVYPPKPYRGMQELYNKLQENGIAVYVVTAANEELVRMVASDDQYGYNVKPQNVFGINLLLKDPQTGQLTTSHLQMLKGQYQQAANLARVQIPYLVSPMTWNEGKAATILGWIDQWRKPILVGGDTPSSDGYMLLNSTDIAQGGQRLWINHSAHNMQTMQQLRHKAAKQQQALGLPVTADKNWLIVTPQQIQ